MMLQRIVTKAEKQLFSLYISLSNRPACNFETQCTTLRRRRSVVLRNHKDVRSFGSVPPPPVGDSFPSQAAQEHQAQHQLDNDERITQRSRDSRMKDQGDCAIDRKDAKHIPVMSNEVLSCLEPKDNQVVVDMTFGAGGHARQILKRAPNVRYIAVDRDPLAFGLAQRFATDYREGQVIPLLSKFSELPDQLTKHGIQPGTVDCVMMDLGVSSMQFDTATRGFALSRDGPLDMRMDGVCFPYSPTAADVVNSLEPHDLARIIKKYGEEKRAKTIAHAIVEARYAFGSIVRTKQLADIIKNVFDGDFRHDKLHRHSHVATKTFQALRIFVNDELNELHNGLEVAHHYLKQKGCCVAISFHSLEDRIVKRHFHGIDMDLSSNISIHSHLRNNSISYDNEEIKEKFLSREWLPLQRKIFEPSETEVFKNPRARSAKLRAATKQ